MQRIIISFSLLFFITNPAHAERFYQEPPPWYFRVSAGAVLLQDIERENNLPTYPATSPAYDFKTGYGFSGAVGRRFSPYAKVEVEGLYQNNELDTVGGQKTRPSSTDKYFGQRSYGAMLNGYLSYPNSTLLTPYVGAGIGMVKILSPMKNVDTLVQQVQENRAIDTSHRSEDWVVGYQFMAGVAREFYFPNSPFRQELLLGYRYLTGQRGEEESTRLPGASISYLNRSHNIELGWRFYF